LTDRSYVSGPPGGGFRCRRSEGRSKCPPSALCGLLESAPLIVQPCEAGLMKRLSEVDLSARLGKKEAEERLERARVRLLHLRLLLGGQIAEHRLGPPLCVVFEGWDASGKGGAIKRLVTPLDPRHVRVAQFAAPTHDEKRHHFLWRFWPVLPGWGGFAVLDRSWYGRVLVERVEGFASEEQWSRAYEEIAQFERTLSAEGMILVKFWMHVSEDEQLTRFQSRASDPLRAWKLTDEDWRNRAKRPEYEAAVEDMLEHTDRPWATWHVVPGDQKRLARVTVVETVCDAVQRELVERGYELDLPEEHQAG
jgi:polyphosphate kinase 2 (PPK2 family)